MERTMIKWMLCLMALLTPLGSYAVGGYDGPTWYDYRDASFDIAGKGSLENPIVITTPGQLAQLSYLVNEEGNDMSGKYVTLGADISLKKESGGQRVQWIPIGYQKEKPFRGTFLGVDIAKLGSGTAWSPELSHTVAGMYINAKGTSYRQTAYVGLFGCLYGFVGYLSMKDCEVNYETVKDNMAFLGLLCGMTYQSVYNVAAEGDINGKTLAREENFFAGGLAGKCESAGIAHCTYKGNIEVSAVGWVGGICGNMENASITDCATNVTINVTSEYASHYDTTCYTGGIAGAMTYWNTVEGCTSAGTIKSRNAAGICGIAANFSATPSRVTACASSCTLEGSHILGGIVSYSQSQTNNIVIISRCVFSGHIKGAEARYVGGICGRLSYVKDELLSRCLMLGTIEGSTATDAITAAIAADAQDAQQTVASCYYDAQLFKGNVTGNTPTHVTIKGLTTEELTDGDMKTVPLLEIEEGATVGFTLRKGYYPAVYTDTPWPGYGAEFDKLIPHSIFGKDDIDKSNTVLRCGAWLASLPVVIPKGDAAYDLVTQVGVSKKNGQWTEGDRTVSVESTAELPETTDFLKLDGNTAKVTANGQFDVTIGGKLTTKANAVFNRPAPLLASKTLHVKATPEQMWDGTTATEYAAGSGTAEDPYIIKNGAQLALAVTTNKDGERFRQLCDITLEKPAYDEGGTIHSIGLKSWLGNLKWKGKYDGNGHYISGMLTWSTAVSDKINSLFGEMEENSEVANLAVINVLIGARQAAIATTMNGTIRNCLVQGVAESNDPLPSNPDYSLGHSGGIACTVGTTNANAIIEDCVSGMFCPHFLSDYSPFVCLANEHKGKVRNCLAVVPVAFSDQDYTSFDMSMSDCKALENCYWLKGYEHADTGFTLEEIGEALSKRNNWQWTQNYFPMLKDFAESDMGRLLTLPVRTDQSDGIVFYDKFLLGFNHQIAFEPGDATWQSSDKNVTFFEADSDMGIISPVKASFILDQQVEQPKIRAVFGIKYLSAKIGRHYHNIPVRTSDVAVNKGITFEDEVAFGICKSAFDTDNDGNLSLAEIKAVTAEQATAAFSSPNAANIKRFPEFRLFKNITKLTNQLSKMTALEEVRLPFALKTIGSNAFYGCTNLKEVTLPAKVSFTDPHPFYGSAVENVYVDPFNKNFKSRDGLLFDANNGLVAYPNGRSGEEATISGVLSTIYEGAIYKIDGLKRLYLDFDDYDRIIPELEYEGIETTDGSLIEVYAKDASEDHVVLDGLRNDPSWSTYRSAKKLFRYFPLKVDESRATTMYVGFDVQLPEQLTPYIVSSTIPAENTAFMQEMERKVPKLSPVVIIAKEAGLYYLLPLDNETLQSWKMYENRLNGSGADGIPVYAEDSKEGGLYSLQIHKDYGIPYFDYCQEERFPPYQAYLPYNSIGDDLPMGVHFLLSQELTIGDWQVYAIPRLVSEGTLTYSGILSDYDGHDRNIVVPASFTASILGGASTEIKIEAFGSNIFAPEPTTPDDSPSPTTPDDSSSGTTPDDSSSGTEIWNIDLTQFAPPLKTFDLKSGKILTQFIVDRSTEGNPFYGVDKLAYIYMNAAGGVDGEVNIVVSNHCSNLVLCKGRDFLPKTDITATTASLDGTFDAATDKDGNWVSKAYTVTLPFDADVPDNAKLYTLKSVDQLKHRFVFSKTKDNTIEAGKSYVMVVERDKVKLTGKLTSGAWSGWGIDDSSVKVKSTTGKTGVKTWTGVGAGTSDCGFWDGTYATIANADAAKQNAYVMQDGGTFRRIQDKQSETTVSPFHAYFSGDKIYPAIYTMVLADDDDVYAENAQPFPAEAYEADTDMSGYDVVVAAIWCEDNKTLYFTGEEDSYKVGDKYDGRNITALWTGSGLLNNSDDVPEWSQTAHEAKRIVFQSSFEQLRPQSLHAWFKDMTQLTTIEGMEYLNTTETKDMSQMFQNCSSLTMLDLSPLTVNVDDATYMFAGCTSLTTIFAENHWSILWSGHDYMFDDCVSLVGSMAYKEGYTDGYRADLYDGYLTPTPYALWCSDNKTLYFTAPGYKLKVGEQWAGQWDGQTITALWKGIAVANSDSSQPAWGKDAASCKRVVFDESFERQRPRSLSYWFSDCWGLEQIEGIEYLNTSEATEANYMFHDCQQIKELDVNSFDVSKMTSAKWMFGRCDNLWTIWCDNTWDIPETENMFQGCYRLKGAVDFSSAKGVDGSMANPQTGYFTTTPIVELKDGQEDYTDLLASYAGKRVHVRYDRKITATRNADGSWNRKAYTVCLPYHKTLYHENSIGQMSLYSLATVSDDGHFIFAEYGLADLKAGHPYVIVVNEGEISLDVDNVKLISQPDEEGEPVYATIDDWVDHKDENKIGSLKGTFRRIWEDEAGPLQIYGQQRDGRWERYYQEHEGAPKSSIGTFRAYFQAKESTGTNRYYPQFSFMPDGPSGVRQILDFPAEEFDGDDINNTDAGIAIQTIDGDGTHRYYDMQGRPLISKPTKGLYIDVQQGKQVCKIVRK